MIVYTWRYGMRPTGAADPIHVRFEARFGQV